MTWPMEKEGSQGENVRSVQYLLNAHGDTLAIDGLFGPLTSASVRSFQQAQGLSIDGIVGDATWPILIIDVSPGDSGDAVMAVQSQIKSRAGGVVQINGNFDAETESVVRYFQGDIGLGVDGIVGERTWNAFVSGYLMSEGYQAAKDFYNAWTQNDRTAASKCGTPAAVGAIFARPWQSHDGWSFVECDGFAGGFGCSWNRPSGQQLVLKCNANTGEPFFFVRDVMFQPPS